MIYADNPPTEALEQGDILKKTDALVGLLTKYHPHYAQHPENKFFTVLTQSCDLVTRTGGGCKARYISLAPVRPLQTIITRELGAKLHNLLDGAQAFSTRQHKASVEQFLHRLFNNNEPPFFYYEAKHDSGIYDDMCAVLALPISLKPEHYETLRRAKLAGITDVFQAKLGWLVGQLYSRVGTPDLEAANLAAKVKSYVEDVAIWLDENEADKLKIMVDAHYQAAAEPKPVGPKELHAMIAQIPKKKKLVIDAVLDVAATQNLIPDGQSAERFQFRRALDRDPVLAKLF